MLSVPGTETEGTILLAKEVKILVKKYKPGHKAPCSGQYGIVGSRGGKTDEERTVVKNEPFPPTPKRGQHYVMNDPTKHRGRK